jgi:hypothetical protein
LAGFVGFGMVGLALALPIAELTRFATRGAVPISTAAN